LYKALFERKNEVAGYIGLVDCFPEVHMWLRCVFINIKFM